MIESGQADGLTFEVRKKEIWILHEEGPLI